MLAVDEMIVDSFAGGGGASEGIWMATGRHPDIAINHSPEALALHARNHPFTQHYQEDVWKVDPRVACAGRRVGLLWLSPDCTHFSKARGAAPKSKRVRGLAWVAVRWAAAVRPRIICLENVEEFQTWGPVLADGRPCPERKGQTFLAFRAALERLGYQVDFREMRACDYGAPTIRKRLFLVARCDGEPISWPTPTHGPGRLPYRTAGECIDWSIPVRSIFERTRPLAEATLRRIAAGIGKFVQNGEPFIVQIQNASSGDGPIALDRPLRTGKHALVAAFLAKHQSERGNEVQGASLYVPAPTVKSRDSTALVTAHIMKLRGTNLGHSMGEPLHTITAGGQHFAEVRTFLQRFAPQATHPLGAVVFGGETYSIADIGMRMLAPRELYRAQGFPDDYQIEMTYQGKPFTKEDQVRMCGNSVSPPIAAAIVRSQCGTAAREQVA